MTWSQADRTYLSDSLSTSINLLKDKRILIAGGTGFLGSVIAKALAQLNLNSVLRMKIYILGRDEVKFTNRFGSYSGIQFIKADIADFKIPGLNFDYIIHSAQDPMTTIDPVDEDQYLRRLNKATETLSQWAARDNAKLIYLSSGAADGAIENTYVKSKAKSEALILELRERLNLRYLILRCFSYVGPEMPLHKDFAASRLISQSILEKRILMNGDGTPVRSYMYSADFAIWAISMMTSRKDAGTYDVGSSEGVSIFDLCNRVSNIMGISAPQFLGKSNVTVGAPNIYLPDCAKTKVEFNLPEQLSLNDSLVRTLSWAKQVLEKDSHSPLKN